MDYQTLFWALAAFMLGRLSTRKWYIGHDKEKYEKANFGILFRKD